MDPNFPFGQTDNRGILSLLNAIQQSEESLDNDTGGLPDKLIKPETSLATSYSQLDSSFQMELQGDAMAFSSCIICNSPPAVDADTGNVNMVDVHTEIYGCAVGNGPVTIASFLAEILMTERLADNQRLICIDCCEIVQIIEKLESQLSDYKDLICRKYEDTMGKKITLPKTNHLSIHASITATDSIRGPHSLGNTARDVDVGVATTLIDGIGSANEDCIEEKTKRLMDGSLSDYPSADTALLELKVPPLNLFDTSECQDGDSELVTSDGEMSQSELIIKQEPLTRDSSGFSLNMLAVNQSELGSQDNLTRVTSHVTGLPVSVDDKLLTLDMLSPHVVEFDPNQLAIGARETPTSHLIAAKENELRCSVCGRTFLKQAQFTKHCRQAHRKPTPKVVLATVGANTRGASPPEDGSHPPTERVKAVHFADSILSPSLNKPGKRHVPSIKAMDVDSFETIFDDSKKQHLISFGRKRVQTKAEKSSLVCEECGAVCLSRQALRFHKSSHTGEFLFRCPECGKGFNNKSLLLEHRHTHTGNRPYACDICPQTFANRGSLWVHKKRHKVDKPYPCEFCSKAFNHPSHAVVHRRTHTGETPYRCRLCPMGFISNTHLKRHMRIFHDNDLPFGCGICKVTFGKRKELVEHGKQAHGGKVVEDVAVPQSQETHDKSLESDSNMDKLDPFPDMLQ